MFSDVIETEHTNRVSLSDTQLLDEGSLNEVDFCQNGLTLWLKDNKDNPLTVKKKRFKIKLSKNIMTDSC